MDGTYWLNRSEDKWWDERMMMLEDDWWMIIVLKLNLSNPRFDIAK